MNSSLRPGSYFVTGTDTGVGKTHVTAALVREWRGLGLDCVGLKPICCGDRDDAVALQAAAGGALDLDAVNPIWLKTPAAPWLAAEVEERPVEPRALLDRVRSVRARHLHVVIEGAGGWSVPITRNYFISNLAADLELPVIVVAANRLGAINHTLLTVDAVLQRGLRCAGIILNEPAEPSPDDSLARTGNRAMLSELLSVPLLGELGFGARAVMWKA